MQNISIERYSAHVHYYMYIAYAHYPTAN